MRRAFKFFWAALALATLGFFAAACDTDGVAVETFTVTYLTHGGSPVPPSTVPKDSRLTLPPSPTRAGSDFDAWHTNQSLNAPFDIDAPITRNMTLHARWKQAEGPSEPEIQWHATRVEAAITEAVMLAFSQEVELDIGMITIGPSTHPSHTFKGAAEKISVVPVEGTAYWTLYLTNITDGWIEISVKGVPDLDEAPARVHALNPNSYLYVRFYPNAPDAAFPGSSAEYFEVRGTRGDVVGEDDMPPKPTRPGHEFSRWTRRPDGGGGEVGPGQGITNLDAHAQWDPLFFNITFDMNGADTPQIASITGVPWGGSAPLPAPPPTREGHYFAGWFHATTAGPEYAEGFSDVRADIPALARWIPHEFTINFEMNGAGSAPIAPMRNVQWNTSRALPSQPPTRAGHDFLGWHSEREGGTRYTAFNNVRENITAWARWQAHTFTVTLRPDPQHLPAPNGSPYGAYTNVKWGEGPNAQDPTRDGYYFIGWFDGNGARCDLTDMRLGKGETLELWARWTQNVYTITFMMNGADSAQIPAITNVPWSTSRPFPPEPTRAGYAFGGWHSAESGGRQYLGGFNDVKEDIVAWARWTPLVYNISFVMNGADSAQIPAMTNVPWGASRDLPPAPTRAGHDFAGWWSEDNGGVEYKAFVDVKEHIAARARWEPHRFDIEFRMNGADSAQIPAIRDVPWSARADFPPEPTRAGYAFGGWHSAESGGQEYLGAFDNVRANIVAWARWTPLAYSISFVMNGADSAQIPAMTNVPWGASRDLPPAPTRAGHDFAGWWSADNGGVEYKAFVEVKEHIAVRARWEPHRFDIEFRMNGADSAQIPAIRGVPWSESRPFPSAPTRADYVFDGWWSAESGGERYLGAFNNVRANIVAWARWLPIRVVTFYPNNETDAPPQTRRAVFGARLALADLPAPERTGHVLTGWNTRADGAGRGFTPAELAAEPITANLDLHAQWRLNRFTVILDQPLDAPAGSPSGEHQVIWGENLELRIPPPDSINFDGWWTQRIGGEQRSLQDMQYGDGDVIILYARWSIKFFRVTFDLNGGTQTGSVSLNQTLTGGASAAVPYPVRNGWIFTGWFTQADGGAQIQSFENVRANIAAVAGWRQSVAGLPWSPIRPNNDREGAPFSGFISSEEIQDLAFGEGSWVAVGGSGKISRSTNGRDFTLVPEGQRLANTRYSRLSVAFGDGWFISAGLGGEMLRSDDGGQNWRRPETSAGVFPSRTSILAVAWGGGGDFVIVGPGARMARSDNHGSTWNTVFSPALAQNFGEGSIRGVGFRRDNIVAVGTGGGIVYSKGANWNSARINPFGSTIINDLAFGVDSHGRPKWIAVGNDRKMAYSTDGGETWTEIFETGVFGDLNAIAYGDGTWVAVASNGTLSYSTNGETFIPVDHGVGGTTFLSSQRILGVAYADNRFYIVGDGGRMAYSVASPP